MKVATWNINGIKARLDNLLQWLKEYRPDIVCLQEIKSEEDKFPFTAFEDLGYSIHVCGQKGFHGVALLSLFPPEEVIKGLLGDHQDHQARFIEGLFSSKKSAFRVSSLYLPNGNPIETDKYSYKLSWMNRLYDFAKKRLELEEPLIFAGDYNVIASAIDARNPDEWSNDALYIYPTRKAFRSLLNLGFTDTIRAVSDEPNYSFWDYQAGAWPRNNGIRIDHLLLSPEAADLLQHATTQKDVRNWEKPSDHVPIIATFDL